MALLGNWGKSDKVPRAYGAIHVPGTLETIVVPVVFTIDTASTHTMISRKLLDDFREKRPLFGPEYTKIQTMAGPIPVTLMNGCKIVLKSKDRGSQKQIEFHNQPVYFFGRTYTQRLGRCFHWAMRLLLKLIGRKASERSDLWNTCILGMDALEQAGLLLVDGVSHNGRPPLLVAPGSGEITALGELHASLSI